MPGLDINCSGALSVTEVKQAFAEAEGTGRIWQNDLRRSKWSYWSCCQRTSIPAIPSSFSNTGQEHEKRCYLPFPAPKANRLRPHSQAVVCDDEFCDLVCEPFCVAQSVCFCLHLCAQIKPQERTTTHCCASQEWTFWLLEACSWLFARAHERSEEVWPWAKEVIIQ